MRRNTPSLPIAALCCLAVFPIVVLALHLVQDGRYHPLRDAVSVLALGRGGWLMAVAFCASGLGTLMLALVLRRRVAGARVGPVLLMLAGCLSFVSAFVHADPTSSVATSSHGRVHELAGVLTFLLIIAAMFVFSRTFRRDPAWRPLARPTLAWAVASCAGFVLIPVSGAAHFGLAQRILLGVLFSWPLALSAYAARVESRDRRRAAAGGLQPA